jgi:hypothetical protein
MLKLIPDRFRPGRHRLDPVADELRARLGDAQVKYDAVREDFEAWDPPPGAQADASLEELQAYNEAQATEFEAWLAREDAWFALDTRLHPDVYEKAESEAELEG